MTAIVNGRRSLHRDRQIPTVLPNRWQWLQPTWQSDACTVCSVREWIKQNKKSPILAYQWGKGRRTRKYAGYQLRYENSANTKNTNRLHSTTHRHTRFIQRTKKKYQQQLLRNNVNITHRRINSLRFLRSLSSYSRSPTRAYGFCTVLLFLLWCVWFQTYDVRAIAKTLCVIRMFIFFCVLLLLLIEIACLRDVAAKQRERESIYTTSPTHTCVRTC